VAEGVATTINGRRKAAILCVTLGKDRAAELFKHLDEEQQEKLTIEMARAGDIKPDQADAVHEEIVQTALARGFLAEGGLSFAREVLERAVGERRANEILTRLGNAVDGTPFDFLRGTPPDQIFAYLRHEHPQTIALVLANLPGRDQAALVMQQMSPEEQAEVAFRVAVMEQTPPDVVKEVANVMRKKMASVLQNDYTAAGGIESLAEILNNADRGTERNVLEHLAVVNEDIAEQVRSLLFVFEDLLKLDDRSIQLVLKEIDSKDLALALRGASEEVRARISANMSQRGAEMLREEMEFMPPQRRRVVEEAQSKIVAVVRRLEDAGEITIARGGGSDEDELVG
jgi:flagellar motor switch protein FliG